MFHEDSTYFVILYNVMYGIICCENRHQWQQWLNLHNNPVFTTLRPLLRLNVCPTCYISTLAGISVNRTLELIKNVMASTFVCWLTIPAGLRRRF